MRFHGNSSAAPHRAGCWYAPSISMAPITMAPTCSEKHRLKTEYREEGAIHYPAPHTPGTSALLQVSLYLCPLLTRTLSTPSFRVFVVGVLKKIEGLLSASASCRGDVAQAPGRSPHRKWLLPGFVQGLLDGIWGRGTVGTRGGGHRCAQMTSERSCAYSNKGVTRAPGSI